MMDRYLSNNEWESGRVGERERNNLKRVGEWESGREKKFLSFSLFRIGVFVFTALLLLTAPAAATVFITVDEALNLAFPGCTIKRRTEYLTGEQLAQARELAGVEIASALVHPYVAIRDNEIVGIAYFDAHVVRTLPETIMIVVDRADRIQRIEILAFNEPQTYIPKPIWYQQFLGQPLDDALVLKRNIRRIAGATLTARATTDAVRRVLAIHHVLKDSILP